MTDINNPTRDTVDALFDETDEEDPFRDFDFDADTRTLQKRKADSDSDKENGDLGVDEQIKITKKRKPTAKLDEDRLLSDQGIPKLRKLYKSKLQGHFKGKGCEFKDAEKLLDFYQLWLDNLFPKAKFADGLAMVEKVGHSKRMQITRRAWIDEGKPKPDYVDDQDDNQPVANSVAPKTTDQTTSDTRVQTTATHTSASGPISGNGAESLFVPENQCKPIHELNVPEEDDLDALLAERTARTSPKLDKERLGPTAPEEEDDLDALLAEYDSKKAREKTIGQKSRKDEGEDEEDDLDALMAEHDAQAKGQLKEAPQQGEEDSPDDLDVLLAEQGGGQNSNSKPSAAPRDQDDEQDDLDALSRANNDWIESL